MEPFLELLSVVVLLSGLPFEGSFSLHSASLDSFNSSAARIVVSVSDSCVNIAIRSGSSSSGKHFAILQARAVTKDTSSHEFIYFTSIMYMNLSLSCFIDFLVSWSAHKKNGLLQKQTFIHCGSIVNHNVRKLMFCNSPFF